MDGRRGIHPPPIMCPGFSLPSLCQFTDQSKLNIVAVLLCVPDMINGCPACFRDFYEFSHALPGVCVSIHQICVHSTVSKFLCFGPGVLLPLRTYCVSRVFSPSTTSGYSSYTFLRSLMSALKSYSWMVAGLCQFFKISLRGTAVVRGEN